LFAITGHEIRATLGPMLGLATTLLVIALDAQPHLPVEAPPERGRQSSVPVQRCAGFSKLEAGRLAFEQPCVLARKPDRSDGQPGGRVGRSAAIGLWMADFGSDGKADILWQNIHGQRRSG